MALDQIINQDLKSEITECEVEIENVVASGILEQPLDLDLIYKTIPGSRYNPQRFPGLYLNLKNPKSFILIFNSGKIISMGTRSVRQAKKSIMTAIKELKSTGVVILKEPKIEIENMVACADLKEKVDLEDSAMTLERTIYEPENFPGLIHIMKEPKVTLLLFTSGKMVCAGARSEEQIFQAVRKIKTTLKQKGLIKPKIMKLNEHKWAGRQDAETEYNVLKGPLPCIAATPT
ncbi:MAG: TATA-box-binding protein [Candidatus Bathyarchaeia archaeon]|nr:TATA-box-binding protein [Candidatus Bathyarchaeota archaeon]